MTTSSPSHPRRSSTLAARGRELDRVRQQVPHHLLQPGRVAGEVRRQRADAPIERDRLRVRRGPDRVDGAVDDGLQIDRVELDAQLAGDDARHVEDVFDQLRLRARVAFDGVQRLLLLLGRQRPRPQHARPADHRVQRRAQLVRQRRQELVLRAVGRLGGLARVALGDRQLRVRVLGALEIFDVGGGADPAGDDAVWIALRDERAPRASGTDRRAPSAGDIRSPALRRAPARPPVRRAGAARRRRARPRTARRLRGPRSRSTTGWRRWDTPSGPSAHTHSGIASSRARKRSSVRLRSRLHSRACSSRRLLAQLALFDVQVDEHAHLGTQDGRVERLHQVVDAAALVSREHVRGVALDRRDEDDRDVRGARVALHQRRGLEAVHARHLHVQQHQRELVREQVAQAPPRPTRRSPCRTPSGASVASRATRFAGRSSTSNTAAAGFAVALAPRLLLLGVATPLAMWNPGKVRPMQGETSPRSGTGVLRLRGERRGRGAARSPHRQRTSGAIPHPFPYRVGRDGGGLQGGACTARSGGCGEVLTSLDRRPEDVPESVRERSARR